MRNKTADESRFIAAFAFICVRLQLIAHKLQEPKNYAIDADLIKISTIDKLKQSNFKDWFEVGNK